MKFFEINLANSIFFELSCRSSSKTDFIVNEAEVKSKDYKLVFSDDEMEEDSSTEEDSNFIADSLEEEHDRNFYRYLNNRENYPRFANQTRNPIEVVNEPEVEYYGEDDMPEFFATDSEKAMRIKNSLVCFSNDQNHFFMLLFMDLCTIN